MKGIYVRLVRLARAPLAALGVLGILERRRDSRVLLWLRSLFAIHDIDDLVRLDLPWWSMSAIERVDAFLAARGAARVFEFGSGASTVWLARRAASVVSVEHDPRWAEIVRRLVEPLEHVELRVVEALPVTVGPDAPSTHYRSGKRGWRDRSFAAYVRSIDDVGGPFDLVVVDGRARSDCLEAAERHLAPGGLIVFDNSGRSRYRRAIERSRLHAVRYGGLTVCLPYADPTTLLQENDPGLLTRAGGSAW